MSDDVVTNNDGGGSNPNSYLWILFLSLLILLLLASMFALCHGTRSFCNQYIFCHRIGGCCCCTVDMEAYRQERESLRRLRELRHVHRMRMEQLQLRERLAVAHALNQQQLRRGTTVGNNSVLELHPIPLETFSQIPGPIPDSFSSSGRVLTPSELQTRGMTPEMRAAYANMSSLGFILVPPPLHLDATHRGPSGIVGSNTEYRDSLTPEQRREILDRLLVFTNYHAHHATISATANNNETQEEATLADKAKSAEGSAPEKNSTDKTTAKNDLEAGPSQQDTTNTEQQQQQDEPQTFAFPLHEEPEGTDKTCAICLDDFEEGELINDASKCPHFFHRDCLLSWLDRHSVCPCCRRPMVTETDWQSAAAADSPTENSTSATSEQQQPQQPTSAVPDSRQL